MIHRHFHDYYIGNCSIKSSHFCCCFYIRIYIIFERHSNSLPRYQDLNVYRLRPVTLDGGVGLKQLRTEGCVIISSCFYKILLAKGIFLARQSGMVEVGRFWANGGSWQVRFLSKKREKKKSAAAFFLIHGSNN